MKRASALALLTVCIAAVHTLPYILFRLDTGPAYRFSMPIGMGDEEVYWARIRDVYDGHWWSGHPFFLEHKNDPYLVPTLAELLVGLSGRALGLGISDLAMAVDGLAPAVIFLLIFLFLEMQLRLSTPWAITGAAAAVLASTEITNPPELVLALLDRSGFSPGLLWKNSTYWIDRTVSPQLHYIIALAYLLLLPKAFRRRFGRTVLLSGILLGLLSYISIFFLAFLVAGTLVFALLQPKEDRKTALIASAVLIVAAGIVSIPFVWHQVELRQVPTLHLSSIRGWVVTDHLPRFSKRDAVFVVVFPLLARRWDVPMRFAFSFIVGGILCTNIQVVLGWNISVWHWMLYTNAFWAVLAATLLVDRWATSLGRWQPAAAALACLFLVANGAFVQTRYYREEDRKPAHNVYSWQDWKGFQPMAPALDWLQRETPRDSVVLAGDTASALIPIFSHNSVYMAYWGQTTPVSTDELLDRAFFTFKLFGVPPERFLDTLTPYTWGARTLRSWVPVEVMVGRDTQELRQAALDALDVRYRTFWEEPFERQACRYRFDYVLLSALEAREFGASSSSFHSDVSPGLSEVFHDSFATLYKVNFCR